MTRLLHALLSLASGEPTLSLPVGVALTLAGIVGGGAMVYGALSTTIKQLQANVVELKTAVSTLTAACTDLATRVRVMEEIDKRDHNGPYRAPGRASDR